MPSHVVIGGGVNGLSVAWGLAEQGADVVVLDKGRIGSGASGINGGIVRNYYRAEAITEVVRRSVEMFEEEPEAYGFHQCPPVARALTAIGDHRVDQHQLAHRHPLADQRCGEASERPCDEYDVGTRTDRIHHHFGVASQSGCFVVAGQVNRDRLMACLDQEPGHATPDPRRPTCARNENESGHT